MSDENENNQDGSNEEGHEDIFNTDDGVNENTPEASVEASTGPSDEEVAEQAEKASMIRMELESLKKRADMIGLKYHPSIGLTKLRRKVNEQLAKDATTVKQEKVQDMEGVSKVDTIPDVPQISTFDRATTGTAAVRENKAQRKIRLRKKASRLIRIRLTNMNPAKKAWPGEVFTVSNSSAGTHRKYVPFNAEKGWHIPQIMLNMITDRKFVDHYVSGKDKRGRPIKRHRLVKEFSVEVLDPLTYEELLELRTQQALANNLTD